MPAAATLPHSFPCSTIGGSRLNFRVRNGNGCDPAPMTTGKTCRPSGPGSNFELRTQNLELRTEPLETLAGCYSSSEFPVLSSKLTSAFQNIGVAAEHTPAGT